MYVGAITKFIIHVHANTFYINSALHLVVIIIIQKI